MASANLVELPKSRRPDYQRALLSSVGYCDELQVHPPQIPPGVGRRVRLPHLDEYGGLRTAWARHETQVLAHPEGQPLARPEGLAAAERLACAFEGCVVLPLASRP